MEEKIFGGKTMNILVTGGRGFIGSHLCKRLDEEGHEIRIVDTIGESAISDDPKYMSKDVRDIVLADIEGVDCIFHLAAMAKIPECITNPRQCIAVNVIGTTNLLESAVEADLKGPFIFASTSAIYDCANIYAASKRAGEDLCQAYNKSFNLNVKISRFFNVYGPGQHPDSDAVINNFVMASKDGKKAQIFGDGNQVRDFIHVDDVVSALILLIDHGDTTPYDFGLGIGTTINQLAEIVGLEKEYRPPRVGDPRVSIAEGTNRTKQDLDWEPKVELRDGIGKMVKEGEKK